MLFLVFLKKAKHLGVDQPHNRINTHGVSENVDMHGGVLIWTSLRVALWRCQKIKIKTVSFPCLWRPRAKTPGHLRHHASTTAALRRSTRRLLLLLWAVSLQASSQPVSGFRRALSSPSFFFFLTLINSYFHCIHKSPLSASSGSPARQFRPQHPSTTDAFAVPPLEVFKPSQSGISGFIYQTPNMRRPSDVPTPDPSIIHFNLCYHILLPPPARPPVLSSTLPLSEHWWCITWHQFYQQQPPTSYLPIRECSQQHDISLKVHNLLLLSAP